MVKGLIKAPLPPQSGNSGKVLTTNGIVSSWTNSNGILISSTTITNANRSSAISITAGKDYEIIINVVAGTTGGPGMSLSLAIAGDETGNDYKYRNTVMTLANPPVETHSGASSANAIIVTPNILQTNRFSGKFFLSTSNTDVRLLGSGQGVDSSSNYYAVDTTGIYTGGVSPTSFMLINDTYTWSGTVKLFLIN